VMPGFDEGARAKRSDGNPMLGVLSAARRSMTHHHLSTVADMTERDLERSLREAHACLRIRIESPSRPLAEAVVVR